MSTKLYPLSQRVVVKRVQADEQIGSIIIPESAKEKPRRGVIIAMAGDTKIPLKVGDKIIFGKYAGVELIVDAVELLVMKEEDVIARVEDIVEASA